jgi:hypothetical protein
MGLTMEAVLRKAISDCVESTIRGIRKPTPKMLDAARDWYFKTHGKAIDDYAVAGCWQAMIDALLTGEGKK